jgi:hypothetical protein
MIGYGLGHVKARRQISMVQRGRRNRHDDTARVLTKTRDTLYHSRLIQLRAACDL